jgi:signal transduction histidine kinase
LTILDPNPLVPHAICWAADPRLIWTMVITDSVTFLSYLTICLTLLFMVRHTRKVIAGDWGYFVVGFALFIVACGITHLMEVVTTWVPLFWVDAWTNILTALLSAWVATMLIQRVSRISFGINDYADRLANTENEKAKMQQSLIDAQKLEDWSRMSAVVSHEIKNPIQAIRNLQFLILSSPDASPQIVEFAQMAEAEAQRVLTISDSTLSFIRQTAKPEPIDLSEAVDSVRFLLDPLIKRRGISFHVERNGDFTVVAFAGEVRQVLLNIIRNACESITRAGAEVNVSLTGKDSGVEVSVADQGTGIDPQILPNIFQFGITTKGDQGNGMGLWTVKHILNKHHGDVKIHSEPGTGTRLDIWWPRAFASPQQ